MFETVIYILVNMSETRLWRQKRWLVQVGAKSTKIIFQNFQKLLTVIEKSSSEFTHRPWTRKNLYDVSQCWLLKIRQCEKTTSGFETVIYTRILVNMSETRLLQQKRWWATIFKHNFFKCQIENRVFGSKLFRIRMLCYSKRIVIYTSWLPKLHLFCLL